jgi:ribosome-binding protein aMBF1 (putative translation factor)
MSNLEKAIKALKNNKQKSQTIPMPKPEPEQEPAPNITLNNIPNGTVSFHSIVRMNLRNIQNEIKTERLNQGLSQRALAIKANMSQATITRVERYGCMSIWALLKISNGLGKTIKLT